MVQNIMVNVWRMDAVSMWGEPNEQGLPCYHWYITVRDGHSWTMKRFTFAHFSVLFSMEVQLEIVRQAIHTSTADSNMLFIVVFSCLSKDATAVV